MALAGFLGFGSFVFFNLTQPNKTLRVWVFSALVVQAGKTPKNSKNIKYISSHNVPAFFKHE